jgi:hypothetical protein
MGDIIPSGAGLQIGDPIRPIFVKEGDAACYKSTVAEVGELDKFHQYAILDTPGRIGRIKEYQFAPEVR